MYPLCNEHATQFRRICSAVLTSYRKMLHRPGQPDRLTPYPRDNATACEWVVERHNNGLRLLLDCNESGGSDVVTTRAALDQHRTALLGPPRVIFPAVRELTSLVQPWGGVKQRQSRRALHKEFAQSWATLRATRELMRRKRQLREQDA